MANTTVDIGEYEDSPIEQVRLTVPTTDDPSLPVLTFRVLILGVTFCTLLAVIDSFFRHRQTPINITFPLTTLLVFPVGKLMAATLPKKSIKIPGMRCEFSLNPGPFNNKEHVLIAIFSSQSSGNFAQSIATAMKGYYYTPLNPCAMFSLSITSQLVGYGLGGIFMKILVDCPYMWWPNVVANVAFYRTLHESEVRSKGQLKRMQFFILVTVSSFAYSIIPGYFFPSITALSLVCWFWKDSVTAQQLGSGIKGLGIGAYSFDWSVATAFLGSPLVYPTSALISSMVGFVLLVYIITPIAYWTNTYNAKRFPLFSLDIFDNRGQLYNISQVMREDSFEFDQNRYHSYSKLYFSVVNVFSTGCLYAAFTSSLTHVALFHGKLIWTQFKKAQRNKYDNNIHNKLMKEYAQISKWWCLALLFLAVVVSFMTCEGFRKEVQLPYWGVIVAVGLGLVSIVPLNVISATTGQPVDVSGISDLTIGYLLPRRPLTVAAFNSYAITSFTTSVMCINDLKLGYYLKIPPMTMFLAQVISAIHGCIVSFVVTWRLSMPMKHRDFLLEGSPWTFPTANDFLNSRTVFGFIGSANVLFPFGIYSRVLFFSVIGAILLPFPVWFLSRKFPEKKWIKTINFPSLFLGASTAPFVTPVRFWTWFIIGITLNSVIYRKYKKWWGKYNYVFSIGLDVGITVMALLANVTLLNNGVSGLKWWGFHLNDHCPLAGCPTESDVNVEGCPTFHS